MAGRIRSIKPEVLEDEVAASLSDSAWRLWVSSWVLADDHGNVRAGSKYLGAHVWQDSTRDVDKDVEELVQKGLWDPYAVKGQRYAHIHAWNKHQRVDNAGKPRVPMQSEADGTWDQPLTPILAETRRESPRLAETRRESPRLSAKVTEPIDSATDSEVPNTEDQVLGGDLAENLGDSPLARRARAQSGGETSDLRPPTSDLDPDSEVAAPAAPPVVGVGMTKIPASETRLWGPAWMDRYAQAVSATLGHPWTFDPKNLQQLVDVIGTHCSDKKRIEDWITSRVTAFVRTVCNDEPKYWSAYQPKGLVRWLNSGGAKPDKSPPKLKPVATKTSEPVLDPAETSAGLANALALLTKRTSGG